MLALLLLLLLDDIVVSEVVLPCSLPCGDANGAEIDDDGVKHPPPTPPLLPAPFGPLGVNGGVGLPNGTGEC